MQLSRDDLLRAYRTMCTIRAFEERIRTENTTGDIPGHVHLYAGQEAIATGICLHLSDADFIGSTHRGHGHCIAKGCDVKAMMREIFGKEGGLCGGKGGSMHIADLDKGMLGANAIVGGNPPQAVGAALSAKTRGTDRVGVSFTGDGGSNQGTTFEAMNMAVVLKLPCLFIIENNGYGEGTPAKYAVGTDDLARRAEGFGMPAAQVDGTDFFAVEQAAREALEHARSGGGPSTIVATALRFFGHFEGDAQQYRPKGEVEQARAEGDCLTKFRARVTAAKLIDAGRLDAIDSEVAALIDDAVTQARAAGYPDPSVLERDVYVSY